MYQPPPASLAIRCAQVHACNKLWLQHGQWVKHERCSKKSGCWGGQVMDAYLRDRAEKNGAQVKNGLYLRSEQDGSDGAFTITYSDYTDGGKVPSPPRVSPGVQFALTGPVLPL